ncbi:hypothetical protein MLD38_014911 [Melastoma candidum]|nr:hypothetical protein MLD38_014911 [Melastoma candidum]
MLGLIAFALLILACSYWKLSGFLGNGNDENDEGRRQDLEAGDGDGELRKPPVFEEKVLVIMAGQVKPTFLATPASSRSSSFGNNSSCGSRECDPENRGAAMVKQDGGGDLTLESGTAQETLPA